MKTRARLAAGTIEVWLVDESGAVTLHDSTGAIEASRFELRLT